MFTLPAIGRLYWLVENVPRHSSKNHEHLLFAIFVWISYLFGCVCVWESMLVFVPWEHCLRTQLPRPNPCEREERHTIRQQKSNTRSSKIENIAFEATTNRTIGGFFLIRYFMTRITFNFWFHIIFRIDRKWLSSADVQQNAREKKITQTLFNTPRSYKIIHTHSGICMANGVRFIYRIVRSNRTMLHTLYVFIYEIVYKWKYITRLWSAWCLYVCVSCCGRCARGYSIQQCALWYHTQCGNSAETYTLLHVRVDIPADSAKRSFLSRACMWYLTLCVWVCECVCVLFVLI